MAELDRLDREFGLGTMPVAAHGSSPRRGRRVHGPVLPGLLVTAVILAAVVALSPDENMRTLRRLAGFEERLGDAPVAASGDGSYAFSMTQRGSADPVAYNPCRVINLAVNPDGAPEGHEQLVDTAISHTSEATGLVFEHVGTTDDRDFDRRAASFGAHPPVLVAWATDDEVPDLGGDVVGIGGSAPVTGARGRLEYATGVVVLDSGAFADIDDERYAQAIVDHEFGHLVGLDHVDDPGELMNGDNVGTTTYGPGDLEGLARLGSVGC
jgi:hypothetical protein